jgi:hypothetical protein
MKGLLPKNAARKTFNIKIILWEVINEGTALTGIPHP